VLRRNVPFIRRLKIMECRRNWGLPRRPECEALHGARPKVGAKAALAGSSVGLYQAINASDFLEMIRKPKNQDKSWSGSWAILPWGICKMGRVNSRPLAYDAQSVPRSSNPKRTGVRGDLVQDSAASVRFGQLIFLQGVASHCGQATCAGQRRCRCSKHHRGTDAQVRSIAR